MMKPILNLNGTSAEELIEARLNAREAIFAAIAAISDVAPNGRDYIGQPEAYERDREIHTSRIRLLDKLYNELLDEATAIQEAAQF